MLFEWFRRPLGKDGQGRKTCNQNHRESKNFGYGGQDHEWRREE
ncbi:MAG: hypothetical protein OJF52_001008 [Nitrospira sp.]|nr:MAG: hypothetical protein OJF52_001008 [Nitrospira sp.]